MGKLNQIATCANAAMFINAWIDIVIDEFL